MNSQDILKGLHAKAAYDYARHVLKQRWIEAESFIMKDPDTAYRYAKNVIGTRWHEAEPYILLDLRISVMYAMDVIQGRWFELEAMLQQNSETLYEYILDDSFWSDAYFKWQQPAKV